MALVSKKRVLKRILPPEANLIHINGNWKNGLAIDLHSISSTLLETGFYKTTRTKIGEYLYEIKYTQNYNNLEKLATEIVSYMERNLIVLSYLDVIIPIPPTTERLRQPVYEILDSISKKLTKSKKIDMDYLSKEKGGISLKSIEEPSKREEAIKGTIKIKDKRYENKRVLLFDDLYRSGTTLKEATRVLYEEGKVRDVYVLTITKTRSKR